MYKIIVNRRTKKYNKELLNELEESIKKIEELSSDDLAKASSGDNPEGMFMYEIGTKFCWDVQFNTDECIIFEITNHYVADNKNMYDVDVYIVDRNGNMLCTPDNIPIHEYYLEFSCLHNGMIII